MWARQGACQQPGAALQQPEFGPAGTETAVYSDVGAADALPSVWNAQEEPTSRGLSFCTWTLVTLKPEVQVVSDCTRDGR